MKNSRSIRTPYFLGNYEFPSKAAAQRKVKEILYSYPLRTPLNEDDHDLIVALLLQHYNAVEKIGCGVANFVVHEFKEYGRRQRGFLIIRKGGSEIDFGIQKAFGVKQSHHLEDAARRAVAETTSSYKQMRFKQNDTILDDMTNLPLHFKDAHVDHASPNTFRQILLDYVTEYGELHVYDCGLYREFSPADAAKFRTFHDRRATLRIIRNGDNTSRKYE